MIYDVRNLSKSFADGDGTRRVLRELSFSVEHGETLSFWGPSGSGKTTLLNLLAGLDRPDDGVIEFTAPSIDKSMLVNELRERDLLRYRRSHIGFVYQFFNLVPALTVSENVLLPLDLADRMHLKEQALARLEVLGLSSRMSAFPNELSGGEQQRAAIARALAHDPQVIFADEPTGNLDAENADNVIELLRSEVRRSGTTLLVATHNEKIRHRSDQVIELHD